MSAFTRTNLKIMTPKATSQEGFLESLVSRLYIQRFPQPDAATTEGASGKVARAGTKPKDKSSPKPK